MSTYNDHQTTPSLDIPAKFLNGQIRLNKNMADIQTGHTLPQSAKLLLAFIIFSAKIQPKFSEILSLTRVQQKHYNLVPFSVGCVGWTPPPTAWHPSADAHPQSRPLGPRLVPCTASPRSCVHASSLANVKNSISSCCCHKQQTMTTSNK